MSDWTPPEGHAGRWILACVAGLAAGGTLGTLWNGLVLPAAAPGGAGIALLAPLLQAGGGAIVGACLGAAQAWALRGAYPGLPAPAWIGATAAAGYLAALLTNLIYGLLAQHAGSIPIPVFVLAGAVVKGVLCGLLYGRAQAWVFDRAAIERTPWVRVVMVGWMLGALLAGMRWLVAPMGRDIAALALGAVIGGAVEGLALGLVAAGAFRFMPPRPGPTSLP
jgi:hypothetical protein